MENILKNFKSQFKFEPKISNAKKFKLKEKLLIFGMGGSHLPADLLKITHPFLDLVIISDFNIPLIKDITERNVIMISYSGNTIEVITALKKLNKKIIPFIISADGYLLSQSKLRGYPYIELPEKNLLPRLAIGYIYISLLKVINDSQSLRLIKKLSNELKTKRIQKQALKLSNKLKNKIPIIYSSVKNYPLAYNFKIRFNETSKLPSFCNYLPEVNHNEIQGFYRFKEKFIFLLLRDNSDSDEIKLTFKVIKKFFSEIKLAYLELNIRENNVFKKIFSTIHLADWLSYYLSQIYKTEPNNTPFIDKIKKLQKDEFDFR